MATYRGSVCPTVKYASDENDRYGKGYLLIKAMLFLNDKRAVNTPGEASYCNEQGGQGQKGKGLSYLILGTKSKVSRHGTSQTPQKRDSS